MLWPGRTAQSMALLRLSGQAPQKPANKGHLGAWCIHALNQIAYPPNPPFGGRNIPTMESRAGLAATLVGSTTDISEANTHSADCVSLCYFFA